MISISDKLIRKYVEYLKGLVEKGEIEPGKTVINIKVGQAIGPPDMPQQTIRTCRAALMGAGYMSKHGNILQGKGIVNTSFGRDSVDEIIETTRLFIDEENGKAGKPGKPKAVEPQEVENDEGVQVNLYELIDTLDFTETRALRDMLNDKLAYQVELLVQDYNEAAKEADRRAERITALQQELKEVKVQLQESREALGRARSNVAPRVVERYVTIDKKPINPGMEHGAAFGKDQKSVVVHRKPLMGHTPKVVRKQRGTE